MALPSLVRKWLDDLHGSEKVISHGQTVNCEVNLTLWGLFCQKMSYLRLASEI